MCIQISMPVFYIILLRLLLRTQLVSLIAACIVVVVGS